MEVLCTCAVGAQRAASHNAFHHATQTSCNRVVPEVRQQKQPLLVWTQQVSENVTQHTDNPVNQTGALPNITSQPPIHFRRLLQQHIQPVKPPASPALPAWRWPPSRLQLGMLAQIIPSNNDRRPSAAACSLSLSLLGRQQLLFKTRLHS